MLLESAPNNSEKARLLAVSAAESGLWLHALPSQNLGTLLDPNSLRIAVGLRLGSKIVEPHKCTCGINVDRYGRHGLSCIKSAGRFYRHSLLNDLVRRALVSVSVPASLEPCGLSRDDGKRPDGTTLIPWRNGRPLVWDATCVDTLAASHLSATTLRAGAAAEQAQTLKHRKYSCLSGDYELAALAVETFGPWSSDMQEFMGRMNVRLIQSCGDRRAGSYFKQRISLAVQRGNALSVLGSMPQGQGITDLLGL